MRAHWELVCVCVCSLATCVRVCVRVCAPQVTVVVLIDNLCVSVCVCLCLCVLVCVHQVTVAVLIDNFISATVEMEADKAAAEAAVLKRKEQVSARPAAAPGSKASDAGRASQHRRVRGLCRIL